MLKECYLLAKGVAMPKGHKMIRFQVSLEDAEKLEGEARKLGLSVSAFIRLLIKQWSKGIKFEKRVDIEGGEK